MISRLLNKTAKYAFLDKHVINLKHLGHFPWKFILHPNLIFILHPVSLNHLLVPLTVLKNKVLLHQLPNKPPTSAPSHPNAFHMEISS